MKLIITSPEELRSERQRLMQAAVKLLKQHGRSCDRYAIKLQNINNKIRKLEQLLGE